MNYPVLAGEMEVIRLAERYGNRIGALPYTVIIDRHGRIAYVKPGPLSGAAAEEVITPLL
jgi:peroxiredoxin